MKAKIDLLLHSHAKILEQLKQWNFNFWNLAYRQTVYKLGFCPVKVRFSKNATIISWNLPVLFRHLYNNFKAKLEDIMIFWGLLRIVVLAKVITYILSFKNSLRYFFSFWKYFHEILNLLCQNCSKFCKLRVSHSYYFWAKSGRRF